MNAIHWTTRMMCSILLYYSNTHTRYQGEGRGYQVQGNP